MKLELIISNKDLSINATRNIDVLKATIDFGKVLIIRERNAENKDFFNVTVAVPPEDGFYTLEQAIEAVSAENRKEGLVITYRGEAKQPVGGSETFDSAPDTGTAYASDSFDGDTGAWHFVRCRTDIEVSGKSMMLGRSQSPQAVLYCDVADGIGTLRFDYMQAFATNVNLNILVNDEIVGNVTTADELNVVKHAEIPVNIKGNFVLKFMSVFNSSGQVAIDNIEWDGYADVEPAWQIRQFTGMMDEWSDVEKWLPLTPEGGIDEELLEAVQLEIAATKQHVSELSETVEENKTALDNLSETVENVRASIPDSPVIDVSEMFNINTQADVSAFLFKRKNEVNRGLIKLHGFDNSGAEGNLNIVPAMGFGPQYDSFVVQRETADGVNFNDHAVQIKKEARSNGSITVPFGVRTFDVNYYLHDGSNWIPSYYIDTDNVMHSFDLENTPIENFTILTNLTNALITINNNELPVSDIKEIVFGDSYLAVTTIPRSFLNRNSCNKIILNGLRNATTINTGFLLFSRELTQLDISMFTKAALSGNFCLNCYNLVSIKVPSIDFGKGSKYAFTVYSTSSNAYTQGITFTGDHASVWNNAYDNLDGVVLEGTTYLGYRKINK